MSGRFLSILCRFQRRATCNSYAQESALILALSWFGNPENCQDRVADIALDRALVRKNNLLHPCVNCPQELNDLFRRQRFSEARKAGDVGEKNSQDLPPHGTERLILARQKLDQSGEK